MKYTPTIGIECHVQLKTKTKLFSGVSNEAKNAKPNTLISHIDFGMPGSLPVLNKEAISLAARAAFALGTKPEKHFKFDRKNYFYPDLPKGYQITQYDEPIIGPGHVNIKIGGKTKRVGITRAHLEEDAGKNIHPKGADYSLVDLNRAGTPLLEIVSEPDIESAEEAKQYAKELYLLMRYADVSDCDLQHGNMRFDVNVSVSRDPKKLGIRCEVKNLNSFRSVHNAVEYEIKRQSELLESGKPVVQETRGWDEAKQKTISQRGKEEAHDYRYFPEPDIPPVELTDEMIKAVQQDVPILPEEWRKRLEGLGLDISIIETLLEGQLEEGAPNYLALIEKHLEEREKAKTFANWAVNIEIPLRYKTKNLPEMDKESHSKLYEDIYHELRSSKLHSTNAKQILKEQLIKGKPFDFSIHVNDVINVDELVKAVIDKNPKVVADIKAGNENAIAFLIGQVMKESRGQANPGLAGQIIKSRLGF